MCIDKLKSYKIEIIEDEQRESYVGGIARWFTFKFKNFTYTYTDDGKSYILSKDLPDKMIMLCATNDKNKMLEAIEKEFGK